MSKPGDQYRELVGTVMAALDPNSAVKTEQWIDGPDGERDMDVEVRGTLNGVPHFVLVECKDHNRPIGIGYVDAFESKIRDLKPNRAIMFSNSSFTKDALKKARRVGIEMGSAMKAGDKLIRCKVQRELVAKRFGIVFECALLFPFDGYPHEIEDRWTVQDLLFDDLPVLLWLRNKAAKAVLENDLVGKIWLLFTFRDEPRWSYHKNKIRVGGIKCCFSVERDWVKQTVSPDVSLGYFDHLRPSVVIPSKQRYTLGIIDNEAWEETNEEWETSEVAPGVIRFHLTLVRFRFPIDGDNSPSIDDLVAESRVEVE